MSSDPTQAQKLRRAAAIASITVAFVLVIAKLVTYFVTDSVSLLSSLVDSTVDLVAASVTFYGIRSALKPADDDHRYGHGKAEPLAALAQAAFIVGSAILLAYEALDRLVSPIPPAHATAGIGVMMFAIVLTLGLVAFQRYVIKKTSSVAIHADSLHYRGDLLLNLSVILALILGEITGSGLFDPLFALAIASTLIFSAWQVARSALDLLMDRELPEDQRQRIRDVVLSHPDVKGLHDMRTRSDGEKKFIELHVEMDRHISLAAAHDIADAVEERLRQAMPDAEIIIHEDPEGIRDQKTAERFTRTKAATQS